MRSRWFKISTLLLGVALLSLALFQAAPPAAKSRPLLASAVVPGPILQVVERSCQDCHSTQTQWPWYAHIRPVASVLLADVERGRKFLNLSEWEHYSRGQKLGFLSAMSMASSAGRMPPSNYTLLHPYAKLSADERVLLRAWAKAESARIRSIRR